MLHVYVILYTVRKQIKRVLDSLERKRCKHKLYQSAAVPLED